MDPHQELSFRPLGPLDLPVLIELAAQCFSADGGQPFAADPDFLSRSYLADAETYAGWAEGGTRLVCVSSLRWLTRDWPGEADVRVPVTTGLVHSAWRRRGIGGHAFDWAATKASPAGRARNSAMCAETEALGEGAHGLYLSRGLAQLFAEDVMQLTATAPLPVAQAPDALILTEWGPADPARFYAVYADAFKDRPGYPGWPQERWTGWISEDDDFRPEWTLLASLAGTDVAFIVGGTTGWITQLGVVPAARGKGLGARLLAEAIERMRSAGESAITLNVNNPQALALYRRFGFTRTGRRARYAPRA